MAEEKPVSEKFLQTCLFITRGYSVENACIAAGMKESPWWDEMRENPAALRDYMQAREYRANAKFEYLNKLDQEVKSGKLDPQAARVIIDSVRWQLAKEKPKVYGDKQVIEHEGTITLSALVESSLVALPAPSHNLDIIDIKPMDGLPVPLPVLKDSEEFI